MVLTRAALEKMSKNDLIPLFIKNNDKLNDTITDLLNKLTKSVKRWREWNLSRLFLKQ